MSSILDPPFANLIIRATCTMSDRNVHGFVVGLSQEEAYFIPDDVINVGDKVSLRMTLPWGLGRIRATAKVEELDHGSQPRARLALLGLSLEGRERVQQYLTRFYFMVARLQSR